MPSWNSPELVILGRGNREEAVLDNCKTENGGGPGGPPECRYYGSTVGVGCPPCSAIGSS